jgi:hypothetical protein
MDNNDEIITADMPPEGVAFGWVNDPLAVEEVVSKLPYRTFADTPAYQMAADELPDHCYLWDFAKQVTGNLLPPANQGQIGSCVAMGTARAIEYTICAEIVNGQKEEFAKLVEEIIYGGSRVEIGGGRLGYGDGSIGAWAASFVKKYGILDRKVYGKYDFTKYSESRCKEYGRYGVPNDIEPEVKKHPVKETVLVTNTDQAMKALYQGWGIAVCSGQGFSMRRDSNGICRASGSWAHCMTISGWTTIDGKIYFRIDNSWGANAHTGPTGPGSPGPEGFYAASSVVNNMLSEKDSFAFSAVEGFPLRKIRW